MTPVAAGPTDMSVVVYMPHHFSWLAPLMRALRAQTSRDRLELVVVVQSRSTFGAGDEVLQGFGRTILVESSEADSHVTAKVVGLRAATSPVVVFAEDHCFPEPEWAASLIRAHESDSAAVGPSMKNGNPATAMSRSLFALHWGSWQHPASAADLNVLPPHNTSYKRSVLLEMVEELPDLLVCEQFFQTRIRATGRRLTIEPSAIVRHCNVSKAGPWWRTSYHGGRLYGAYRVRHEHLTSSERVFRAATTPLVPVVRMRREISRIMHTGGSPGNLAATIALALGHLIIHAAGEAAGYLTGAGNSELECVDLETSRFRDMSEGDLMDLRVATSTRSLDPIWLASQ